MIAQIAIIRNKENSLTIEQIIEAIDGQAVPILWAGNEGRFRLLPQAVVQNLLDLHEGLQQTQDPEYKTPQLFLVWSQGIEISNDIGRILAGE